MIFYAVDERRVLFVQQILVELAKVKNSIPLPKIIGGPGISLPPEADTLIAPNYQLAVPTRTASPDMDEDIEWEADDDAKDEMPKDVVASSSQPTHLQKSDQDAGRKVSFSIGGKRPKS